MYALKHNYGTLCELARIKSIQFILEFSTPFSQLNRTLCHRTLFSQNGFHWNCFRLEIRSNWFDMWMSDCFFLEHFFFSMKYELNLNRFRLPIKSLPNVILMIIKSISTWPHGVADRLIILSIMNSIRET